MSATSTDLRPSNDYGLVLLTCPVDPQLDVVFVHGLDGSRCDAWTNARGTLWLFWLGEMVPTARIWAYGYKSTVWRKPSKDTLDAHGTTLLRSCRTEGIGNSDKVKVVFVGHSLGGILIKASLIQASKAPKTSDWAPLYQRVISVVFLGTPHRGSEWANRLYIYQFGARMFWRPSNWVALIRKRNPVLFTVAETFNNIWGTKSILTIKETKGVPIIGLIVRPEDAMTNCVGEHVVEVPFDHSRIAKALFKEEIVSQTIADHLSGLISMDETTNVPPQPSLMASNMQRTFYLHLQKELENNSYGWKTDDIDFQSDIPRDADDIHKASKFRSGAFYFAFPGHEATTVTLKFPSSRSYAEAKWTIDSDDSLYHPGSHTGRLVFPSDFPMNRPQIIWDSPIFSAFVRKGRVCVDYPWTRQSFYDVLYGLAAVVIFGSELEITTDPTVPQRKYRCCPHSKQSPILLNGESDDTDRDWIMRVTSFFSRVYNRPYNDGEVDESRQIAEIQRKTALKAIADFQEHIGLHRALQTRDPNVAFKQVVTQGELLREERVWADILNDASSGMVTQAWGRAETCAEHAQRLAASQSPRSVT